jgi:hypothetical protein
MSPCQTWKNCHQVQINRINTQQLVTDNKNRADNFAKLFYKPITTTSCKLQSLSVDLQKRPSKQEPENKICISIKRIKLENYQVIKKFRHPDTLQD